MNYKKFFEEAKNRGIEVSEITSSKSKSTSISLFHGEIDSYSISDQSSIKARGIYGGKLGMASTERLDNGAIGYLIDEIINTASFIEKEEAPIIFKGSEKYHKKNVFNKELSLVPIDEKIKKLHELEDATYKQDKRVVEVQVAYEESEGETVLTNSYGLNLKSHENYFYYVVQVVVKDDAEIQSGAEILLDKDFSKFNPEELAKKVVEKTVRKFHGQSIKPKTYKCVLNQSSSADFLTAMVNAGFSAEAIQKNSSVLVGKLNERMFSPKVTIEENPLTANCFFTYFDSEGVATRNKKLVDKGVIKTYLYDLETAALANTESTGNGYFDGMKISPRAINISLKPGRSSEEELIKKCKNGVYVTAVQGLHSGLNAQSGDFSLQAEGFLIKDGVIAGPLTVITVGGNIYSLFNDVLAVGNNPELELNTTTSPSILVKGLQISSL